MMVDPILENLISAWLDGRINESESEQLQKLLMESLDARHRFRRLTNIDASLRSLAYGDIDPDVDQSTTNKPETQATSAPIKLSQSSSVIWSQLAFLTVSLGLVGVIGYSIGRIGNIGNIAKDGNFAAVATEGRIKSEQTNNDQLTEKMITGYATLQRVAGIQWADGAATYSEGDLLPAGLFEFDQGVAEIDFFCGATLVVEGPAKLDLESDWVVRLSAGRLRANVPPAARGFVVKAADSEIIDLGTEFALEVRDENIRVKVIDGEVKLRGGEFDGKHLFAGQGQSLLGAEKEKDSFDDLSTIGDVQRQRNLEQVQRFNQWKSFSRQLRNDDRLLAYYPIAESKQARFIPNEAASGDDLDGKIVGHVQFSNGRFGNHSSSLNFYRPGSRVRARIDGEFSAYTFACWAKIDSLDNLFNALFMSDGYENGEPHWQIHKDGRIMFSVMVDDTPGSGMGPAPWARLHHIYYTRPIWDVTLSGKWIHLAAVYDPANRTVKHYLNGDNVGEESIEDKYHVEKLRIGPAEIGNWGQPFRPSPDFAARNLNGSIDEIAVFGVALDAAEIYEIYAGGKPCGY